jgi:hypothetical protein
MTVGRRDALGILVGAASSTILPGTACARPRQGDSRAAVAAYFRKLPSWDEFSSSVPDGPVRCSNPTQSIENDQNCTKTEYTLQKNSDKLVILDPDRDVLWPGALVQGKGYSYGIGSLRELPIKKRAPLRIGISFFSDVNYDTIKQPSAHDGQCVDFQTDSGRSQATYRFRFEGRLYKHSVLFR